MELTNEKEIKLYQAFCLLFKQPERFTTTESTLNRICIEAVNTKPNASLEELITSNNKLVEALFKLPEIPTYGNKNFDNS